MKLDLRKNNCSLYVFVSKGLRLTRKTILKPKKRKLEIIKNRNRIFYQIKIDYFRESPKLYSIN